ncbi:hypothetical protein [Pseudanabaena cinerea]|nr:hypothetical protein [Pseudanabaena cinerea]
MVIYVWRSLRQVVPHGTQLSFTVQMHRNCRQGHGLVGFNYF